MQARGRTLRRWVPGLEAALTYRREWLWPDIRAGLVLTALLIPAGMGYAQAAGLPAYTGLYATIVPLLAYAVFGPSRVLVIGPDSALAPIIAAGIIPLALGDEARAVALAGLMAIMVGAILIVGGLLRLGIVTDLLSKPLRIGYLNAIALVVIISQLPKLFGFGIDSDNSVVNVLLIGRAFLEGRADVVAGALGVGALVVIAVLSRIWGGRIPGVFVAVVAGMLLTAVFGLSGRIPVVGEMPQGLPAPSLGGLEAGDLVDLLVPALGVALIAFADTGVLSRTLAARRGETVSGNREMVGLGIANVAGGALGGFPVSGSTSRTPVAEAAGGRSQLVGVVGALLVLAFMLVIPWVTVYLPESVLAAVVIMAVLTLIDIPAVFTLFRVDRADALLSVGAFLGVFLVGVLQGILVAVALSFLSVVIHSWRPYRAELGRIPGVRGYHDRARNPESERIPGVLILRWDAPLIFTNARIFGMWVRRVVEQAQNDATRQGGVSVRTVVVAAEPITDIDTTAMDEVIDLDEYLSQQGIELVLAEAKGPVRDLVRRHGFGDRFPPERFPPTVGAAVDAETGRLRSDIGEVGEWGSATQPGPDDNHAPPQDERRAGQ